MNDDPPKLTPMERLTLEVLASMTAEHGRAPSMSELAARMQLQRSGAQRHLQALKTKGAITGPQWVGEWQITKLGKKLQKQT